MVKDNYIYSALIVSGSDKGKLFFKNLLLDAYYSYQTKMISDSQEARREFLDRDYDLVIINSPLTNESGIELASQVALEKKAMVILVVKMEVYEAVYSKGLEYGFMVIPKPINKMNFYQTLYSSMLVIKRTKEFETEIKKTKDKLDEARNVSKAKCLLIENEHMTEEDAHRFIEKKAMDTREKRSIIAIEIIKKYSY